MTTDRLTEFFDACNDRDVDRIVAFFADDGVYHASIGAADDGTSFRGAEELWRGFDAFFTAYAEPRYGDLVVHVDGDSGFATWTLTGVTRAGEAFRYRGVDVFEFVGDLISVKDAFRKERAAPIGG